MEAVFLKILNMSISAVWLIIAVAVLRVVFKKAPKTMRVVLWGLAALRLMIPFSFESVLSLIPSGETVPQNITVTPTPSINSGVEIIDNAVNPIIIDNLAPVDVTASVNPMQIVIFAAAAVWLLGMIVMLTYCMISYALLYGRVKASLNEESNIYLCDDITSPFIFGIFKPRIYIPSGLKGESLRHVLAHERAHINRLDYLWKPIGFAVLTVHWFNPFVWIAYVLLCRDIEFACDEKVIKTMGTEDIRAYSETLLSCSVSRKMITACPVAFGEVGVKQRIKSVLNYKKPLFWVIIVAVLVCIATAVFFLTTPPADNGSSDGQSGVTDNGAWFDAVIIEDSGERWLVSPCEGTAESRSSDKIYVKKTDNGSEKGAYGVDSLVRIYYDGIIQEIYPAIIPNVSKIELKDTAGTKILFEYKSAWVKYVTDRNDPIYANAVNSGEFSGSNAPVHVFNDLESFGDFIRPYALANDGEHGVAALLKEYNKAYFAEKSVILIYSVESTVVHNIPVKMVRKNNGLHFEFNVIKTDSDLPFGPQCRIFAIEISKKDLEDCDVFYASPAVDGNLAEYPAAPKEGDVPFEWKAFHVWGGVSQDNRLKPYVVCASGETLYRFDTYNAVCSVGGLFGSINQRPSINAKWYDVYGEDYFKEKTLFAIHVYTPSISVSYEITGVKVSSVGNLEISVNINSPYGQAAAVGEYVFAIEMERKYVEGIREIVLKESYTMENDLSQKNIVTFAPPENVKNLKLSLAAEQVTGILDKNDKIFTEAVNKNSLKSGDAVYLPLHIFERQQEYSSFVKQYEWVATNELPAGHSGSLPYIFDSVFEKNKAILIYIDPTMVAGGRYNLCEPRVKDGKLIFPVVCDGWYNGDLNLENKSFGWLVEEEIPAELFNGVKGYEAIAFQSIEEYNDFFN